MPVPRQPVVIPGHSLAGAAHRRSSSSLQPCRLTRQSVTARPGPGCRMAGPAQLASTNTSALADTARTPSYAIAPPRRSRRVGRRARQAEVCLGSLAPAHTVVAA